MINESSGDRLRENCLIYVCMFLTNTEELGAFIQMRAGLVLLFNRCVLANYDIFPKQIFGNLNKSIICILSGVKLKLYVRRSGRS